MNTTYGEHKRSCIDDGMGWRPEVCSWCEAMVLAEERRPTRAHGGYLFLVSAQWSADE